jgi:hypothetical protein
MSSTGVRVALETKLMTVPRTDGITRSVADWFDYYFKTFNIDTVFENAPYNSTPGVPFQIVSLVMADPLNSEMGNYFQEQGYMQVTLYYPYGVGTNDVMSQAYLLRDYFFKGLSLTAKGVTVTINRTPTIGNGVIDGDRFAVPVKIRFNAQ